MSNRLCQLLITSAIDCRAVHDVGLCCYLSDTEWNLRGGHLYVLHQIRSHLELDPERYHLIRLDLQVGNPQLEKARCPHHQNHFSRRHIIHPKASERIGDRDANCSFDGNSRVGNRLPTLSCHNNAGHCSGLRDLDSRTLALDLASQSDQQRQAQTRHPPPSVSRIWYAPASSSSLCTTRPSSSNQSLLPALSNQFHNMFRMTIMGKDVEAIS